MNGERNIQALLLDYDRFQSESILASYEAEAAVLREITPDIPITTNLMGTFKPLDYHRWAKSMDVISWDCYPGKNAPPAHIAFAHSLMRGLKEGMPWLLMEQTPSQQNWQAQNAFKRPRHHASVVVSGDGARGGFRYVLPVAAWQRRYREVPRRGRRA